MLWSVYFDQEFNKKEKMNDGSSWKYIYKIKVNVSDKIECENYLVIKYGEKS